MISFCSAVISKNLEDYLSILTDTLCRHTKYVKEVILVKTDLRRDKLIKSWSKNGIEFKLFGLKQYNPICPFGLNWQKMICGHAMGLYQAIQQSTQKYVWMSDPDVFLFTSVDKIYLDLINKHDLNLIGVSHFNAEMQSYEFCPCIINCMVKKEDLPPPNWLGGFQAQTSMKISDPTQNVFSVGDCWLIPGYLPEHVNSFPNPSGIFDAGCNLWLWNELKKGKWLSFYVDTQNLNKDERFLFENKGFENLVYPLNYNTSKYKSNFGLKEDLGNLDLLYHRTRGSYEDSASYKNLYHSIYQV